MRAAYIKTESAVVLWDLPRLERDIYMRKYDFKVRSLPVVDLVGQCPPICGSDMLCDISAFPIVLSLAPDKYCLASGEAQINKARRLGFWDLECYFVEPRLHKKYIIDYDAEVYRRAVKEYWADEA